MLSLFAQAAINPVIPQPNPPAIKIDFPQLAQIAADIGKATASISTAAEALRIGVYAGAAALVVIALTYLFRPSK